MEKIVVDMNSGVKNESVHECMGFTVKYYSSDKCFAAQASIDGKYITSFTNVESITYNQPLTEEEEGLVGSYDVGEYEPELYCAMTDSPCIDKFMSGSIEPQHNEAFYKEYLNVFCACNDVLSSHLDEQINRLFENGKLKTE